jgi:uncharacterized membrane protein YbaN (DUF454 family)
MLTVMDDHSEDEVFDNSKLSSNRVIRALWTAGGTIFLGLGIIGIILPLLPTTPFLLLAAFCYLRGSERMHGWLLGNKWFGEFIRNYQEKRGIPLRIKIWATSCLWITIAISIFFFIEIIWIRIILVIIAAAVTYHIVTFKTL